MANYTCVAENVAGKRIAEQAMLTVYGKQSLLLLLYSLCRLLIFYCNGLNDQKIVTFVQMRNDFSEWRLEFLVPVV